MLLADLVAASEAVGATRSRKQKVAALADLFARAAPDEPLEVEVVTTYLGGSLRQRRTGLGWRSLTDLPPPAADAALSLAEVDGAFEEIAALAGPGSQTARREATARLFGRATAREQAWLRGVVTGEVRQGALDSLVQEAVAAATGAPLPAVRRAAMLAGSTVTAARAAVTGGEPALAAIGLRVMRPVTPMLASTAPSVAEALAKASDGGPVAIDTKLDGIRIQVHRDGDAVRVATRTLEDITARLPEVVEATRALPARSLVLDGEAIALAADGRPRPFQETASRTASAHDPAGAAVTPYFFDLLHLDGRDLIDEPGATRLAALDALVPERWRTARLVTDDPGAAETFARDALAAGHEGVVVKALDAPWVAGRRGASWIKVKPRLTLDLVVLAVEWGSGRRRGLLSNIHLGARDPEGGFVMLGKTFKGMTDETLAWQTERFLALADGPADAHVVTLRPEQVVEIACDGLQRSSRYPGGLALRFARVLRYRDDKTADEADTIEQVQGLARAAPG